MNLIKTTTLKLARTNWILVMLVLPVLYGLFFYWYLGRYNNLEVVISLYGVFYNCLLPFGMALMISLYIQYEEQIGHFNHLLQLPRRDQWLMNMIVVSWLSVGISTLITCVPLWLLVGSTHNLSILYYFLFTTLFSLPIIMILWFVTLKINMGICLGTGAILSVFLVTFGAKSLGDGIWPYIPLLYGTRYLSERGTSNELFIFSMFLLCTCFLLAFIMYWFKRWEGRIINE